MVKASLLNVEKVVNPPHSPTISSNLNSTGRLWRAIQVPNSPIRKQPTMLTANVPHGNAAEPNHLPTKYRNTLPVPPPTNTNNNSLIEPTSHILP